MIDRGDWGAGDDRRMLRAMWKLKPEEEYEVPWGKIVEGRTSKQVSELSSFLFLYSLH